MDDQHLTLMLDIQKQIGNLGIETARQSEILNRIDSQVQRTNGRVTSLEADKNIRQGKMAVIGAIVGAVASILVGFIINLMTKN